MALTVAEPPRLVRLLDLDPELGARLREDDRAEARELLRLRTAALPPGEWSLGSEDRGTNTFGLIVVDGLLLQEVHLGGRRSQQLLGRGDVVLPIAEDAALSLDVATRLVVAAETRIALLDDRLQRPFALWPGLALSLIERVGRQAGRSAVQAAIAQLPRVEDRLEATFWALADRWGRVTPSGVHIPLRLTHEALARIVGGRRPTISLALTALAERGIVARHDDGTWLVVAHAPTLTPNDPADVAAAPVSWTSEATRAVVVPRPPPWQPQARQELLATASRVGDAHADAARRLRADRGRYEETRRASRTLRDRTARQRAEREADRAARATTVSPLRVPPAPSAG